MGNGHNHYDNCDCNWCNHEGKRSTFYFPIEYKKFKPFIYESFVYPNAKCPVCGAPVFFYQNSYGSRVYFDKMGPPWPKHGCTSAAGSLSTEISDGWHPIKSGSLNIAKMSLMILLPKAEKEIMLDSYPKDILALNKFELGFIRFEKNSYRFSYIDWSFNLKFPFSLIDATSKRENQKITILEREISIIDRNKIIESMILSKGDFINLEYDDESQKLKMAGGVSNFQYHFKFSNEVKDITKGKFKCIVVEIVDNTVFVLPSLAL